MTGTPLERASAAVMAAMGDGPGSRDYLRAAAIARAVLEAVRQPTTPMFRAADDAYANRTNTTGNVVLFDEDYTTIYTAMIDAAIAEG